MISVDTEFYSSPYYFLIRDKGDKYSLYFSAEETLTEARKKDEVIHFDKKKGKKVKNYLEKTVKDKKKKSTKTLKTDLEELVNSDGAMSNSAIPIVPTPAAARYMSAGEPKPPAPTQRTFAFINLAWPAMARSGMIKWRL